MLSREELLVLLVLLGRGVFDDLLAAGWLKPCCEKDSPTKTRKLYSMRDVEHCEARLQGGEYPQAAPVRQTKL